MDEDDLSMTGGIASQDIMAEQGGLSVGEGVLVGEFQEIRNKEDCGNSIVVCVKCRTVLCFTTETRDLTLTNHKCGLVDIQLPHVRENAGTLYDPAVTRTETADILTSGPSRGPPPAVSLSDDSTVTVDLTANTTLDISADVIVTLPAGSIGAGNTTADGIAAGNTTADSIAAGNTTADSIAAGNTTADSIAAGNTTFNSIADGNTTADSMADGSTTADSIANGSPTAGLAPQAGPSQLFPAADVCLIANTDTNVGLILDQIRSSVETSVEGDQWRDLLLVSTSDRSSVRLHSCVVASSCPLLSTVLRPLYDNASEDIITVLFPDISRAELESFARYLYGQPTEHSALANSFLFSLISFDRKSSCGEVSEPDLMKYEAKTFSDSYKTKDIKKILAETPELVKFANLPEGSEDVLQKTFLQILIRSEAVPFLQCKVCRAIFMQRRFENSTVLTRHAHQHSDANPNTREKAGGGEEEEVDGGVDKAGEGAEARLARRPEEEKMEEEEEGEERGVEVKEWDPTVLENLKREPQQQLRQQLHQEQDEEEEEEEDDEGSQGVSKFALEQLIKGNSPRVTFEKSRSHSSVWKQFLRVLVDAEQVPFACCKLCQKLYTHDRSLGTSSLRRHVCEDKEERMLGDRSGDSSGSIPRQLVQELVNTRSKRLGRKALADFLNNKVKDVTFVFDRLTVDTTETEFIGCRYCDSLFQLTTTKKNYTQFTRIESHNCYIRSAPCNANVSIAHPQDEKEFNMVYVREPSRIVIRDKMREERSLYTFLLDGKEETDFCHCTKCRKFLPLSTCLSRRHRCHPSKTAEHGSMQLKVRKKFECELCQTSFKSIHFLEIHRRREHGEGSATVMCSYCAKEFPTERLAKKHELNVHHPDISKKFRCSHAGCDMAFHDRSKLRIHSIRHISRKPFVCDKCGRGFNLIASLQSHMDTHTGVKKFQCDYCQRNFTKRNTLSNHRRLHTGERPFLCPAPECGLTFVQRTACKTHAKKKHNIDITVYTRNPAVPLSASSLAQLSTAHHRVTASETAKQLERVGGNNLQSINHHSIVHKIEGDTVHTVHGVQVTDLPPGHHLIAQGQVIGQGHGHHVLAQGHVLPPGHVIHILHPSPDDSGPG